MTDPSSITSITEEDDSDESDTTETSSNSKASDGVSSILYSSECNTDDKLTPSLVKISISNKYGNPSSKKRHLNQVENDHSETTNPLPYPYGCNPLPLQHCKQKNAQPKKKQKKSLGLHSNIKVGTGSVGILKAHLSKKSPYLPKQEEENFGVDDVDNCLYTDFSDTSSKPPGGDTNTACSSCQDQDGTESEGHDQDDEHSFRLDMTSEHWYKARCFDRYWSHYHFVMEWYQKHVQAVNVLSHQMSFNFLPPHFNPPHNFPQPRGNTSHNLKGAVPMGNRRKAKRSKKRARNRRLSKAKQKAAQQKASEDQQTCDQSTSCDSEDGENELEMEITDDMMDFFAASFKHRMERDKNRNEENAEPEGIASIKKGKGEDGRNSQTLLGPVEQPGARRTVEMQTLYGGGAPMIQGMETALQMTYDNFLDRHQPKLWPNMPLKIVFA